MITLGPLALGLGHSVLYSFGLTGLMNDGFTLAYWHKLWSSNDALQSMFYSTWLTVVSLLFTLGLSLILAWQFSSHRGLNWLYRLFFLPLLFPPLVAAFAWFYLLSPGGFVSRLAYQLHFTQAIEDFPRWTNDDYSVGILIAHVFLVFPIFTLLFIAQARKERIQGLMDTSLTLGSTKRQFFWRVYAPLILTRSRPMIWLYAIFLLGTYEVPLVLGRSSPRPVTLYITDKLTRFDFNNIPLGHAMAALYTLSILLVISIFIRKRSNILG